MNIQEALQAIRDLDNMFKVKEIHEFNYNGDADHLPQLHVQLYLQYILQFYCIWFSIKETKRRYSWQDKKSTPTLWAKYVIK